MEEQRKRSIMQRDKAQPCLDHTDHTAFEKGDSPTIRKLIEKLNQDLEETVKNAADRGHNTNAAW
jgi:hypothetical protein